MVANSIYLWCEHTHLLMQAQSVTEEKILLQTQQNIVWPVDYT